MEKAFCGQGNLHSSWLHAAERALCSRTHVLLHTLGLQRGMWRRSPRASVTTDFILRATPYGRMIVWWKEFHAGTKKLGEGVE